ncbi:YjbF family lipoprotein [Neptunicoccus cionae]|uniref:YjbF family lipoprotein n=1 Tax=Neptunicoccus cionae TaxID=2035344 RepID=A0A916R5F1_9RHOB|nr:YjbF family lipoprotein [Amylibacter cionae]GGA29155.1 hypothetical protein GCM10011498_32880 [Amylibacter cionae]
MTFMTVKTLRALVCGAGLALGLVACGSDKSALELTEITKRLGQRAMNDKAAVAASQQAVLQVSRADVDAAGVPILRVRIEGTGAMSTLAEVDRQGAYSTYMTGDGIGLLFRGGVLVGTRGLGDDLMGLSSPGLAAAIKAGESTRAYRYLDGDEKLATVEMSCLVTSSAHGPITILDRSYGVRQVKEWCQGEALDGKKLAFENFYWVESGSGRVRQSRQFISEKFGRAEIEVLSPR